MKKAIAILALLGFVPALARGQAAEVCEVAAVPQKGTPLILTKGEVKAPGWWFSDPQVIRIDQKIEGCEESLSRCLFDKQVAVTTTRIPPWVWVTAGALVVGAAWGVREVAAR